MIVDIFSRFSPAVDPRFSYRGEDVVLALERVCRQVGYPQSIRVDQGSEFISRDLDLWAYQKGVVLEFAARTLRVQPAAKAHGQCLYRGLQWQVPGRVPQRPLVPQP
jgi:transposase InsO family protein